MEKLDMASVTERIRNEQESLRSGAKCQKCWDTGITNPSNAELRSKSVGFSEGRTPAYCACPLRKKAETEHRASRSAAMAESEAALSSKMRSLGFPDRYAKLTRADFTNHPTNRMTEEQFGRISSFRGNLTIVGPAGIGKTALACVIAKEVAAHGEGTAAFATVQDISRLSKGYVSGEDAMKKYRFATVLVLDDLGIEKTPTPFETRAVFDIVNERYSNGYRTIVTSNLSMKELAEAYGVRAIDRLNENGMVIKLGTWKNLRSEAAKAANAEGKFIMEL